MSSVSPRVEISPQECRLFRLMQRDTTWLSNREIASLAQVELRTATNHTRRLSVLGILERMEIHPAPRFRLRSDAQSVAADYYQRLENACVAMGMQA